jgi:hypothetical protein
MKSTSGEKPNYDARRLPISKGMCNMGSTCFMNSVLQVIIHNSILREAFGSISTGCTKPSLNMADYRGESASTSVIDVAGAEPANDFQTNGCICCEVLKLFQSRNDALATARFDGSSIQNRIVIFN